MQQRDCGNVQLSWRSRQIVRYLPGLIFLVALTARLMAVHRGIPYLLEWDEPFSLGFVIRMFQRGDFNPQIFQYGSVSLYVRLPVVYAHYFYLHTRHLIGSPHDIQLSHPQAFGAGVFSWVRTYPWYSNYPSFYVWSRALTALFGAATVFLVYRLGRGLFGETVGLLAAAFLALAPGAIYYSATVRPDILMTFFVVAAALSGAAILSGGARRDYIVAGLLAGIAISTKWNAFPVMLALCAAHILNPRRNGLFDANVRFMGYCIIAGVLIGTPYLLITPNDVFEQMQIVAMQYGGSPSISIMASALPKYLAYLIWPIQSTELQTMPHPGLGLVSGIAVAVGLAAGWRMNRRSYAYLIVFPAAYLLYMSGQRAVFVRSVMPVLPFAAILAAVGSVWVWREIQSRIPVGGRTWRTVVAGLAVAALLIVPVREALAFVTVASHYPDTRTEAVEWLRNNIPATDRVAFDKDLRWFLPDLNNLPFTVIFAERTAAPSWYIDQHVDVAVVGDKTPLSQMLPLAAFPRPRNIGVEEDEGWRDIYPLIHPPVLIVKIPGRPADSVPSP